MSDHTLNDGGFESRSAVVFSVVITMICLSTTFVAFRFISRGGIVKRISLDDYFIALAWVRIKDDTGADLIIINTD